VSDTLFEAEAIPMRSLVLLSGAALGLLACSSEETPTDPSRGVSLGRAAGSHYIATALDPLHRISTSDFNSRGQVVGSIEVQVGSEDDPFFEQHASLWEKGVVTDLGVLGARGVASAINPGGQIAGVGGGDFFTDYPRTALFWDKGAVTFTRLSLLPGTTESVASDINPSGQIVGLNATTDGLFRTFAVRWEKGVVSDLGTLGGTWSEARGINPAGQIVGFSQTSGHRFHAFLWTNGVMRDLGTLGGGDYSSAEAINAAGQVVGASGTTAPFQTHAFLWANGVMTDLGTLGGESSFATDINASGQVIGAAETPEGHRHAFIWEDGVMTDLGVLVDDEIESIPTAISAAGDVLGDSKIGATLWTRH
jgi:probable HAF family extracellular repeat protein